MIKCTNFIEGSEEKSSDPSSSQQNLELAGSEGMLKKIITLLIIVFLIGCSFHQQKLPSETPEKVVERFFKLLAEGGPSSLAEARKMVSGKYYNITEDKFKQWVEYYPPNSEIKNFQSNIIKGKKNEVIAQVTLEYSVSSDFGGTYNSKSVVNLILDDKSNTWKIDFTAETLPEDQYKNEAGG